MLRFQHETVQPGGRTRRKGGGFWDGSGPGPPAGLLARPWGQTVRECQSSMTGRGWRWPRECGLRDRRQHRRLCGRKQTGRRGELRGDWKSGGNSPEGLQRIRKQQASQSPTGLRYCPVTGKRELCVGGSREAEAQSAGSPLRQHRAVRGQAEPLLLLGHLPPPHKRLLKVTTHDLFPKAS